MRERAWELGEDWGARPSGLFVPAPLVRRRERPIAIDCFCGAGGFSLGLIAGGIDVVAAIDHDPTCMMTYLHNLGAYPVDLVFVEESDRARAEKALSDEYRRSGWCGKGLDWRKGKNGLTGAYGEGPLLSGSNRHNVLREKAPHFDGVRHFFLGDMRKLTGHQVLDRLGLRPGDVDLVVGGPPCQGFSTSGKRDVYDPRNSLVFEWARFVLEVRPKAMVMEEVPNILNMTTPEGVPVVDALCRVLSDGDFGGFDALKASLLGTSGAGGAVRGGRSRREAREASRAEVEAPGFAEQQSLWGAA